MRGCRSTREGRGRRTVAVALALAAANLGGPGLAFGAEDLPAFGMIGLAQRQTAVLNLVLVNPPDDRHPGCRVTASFVDAKGRVFRDRAGNVVEETFVLKPQIAEELVLLSADVLRTDELRRPIRATLSHPPDDGTASDCRCLVATRELVEASGHTSASDVGLPPQDGPNPPPPPPVCTFTAMR
jgi:hypothetical protein